MEQNLFKVAEVQLSYRPHFRPQERPKINSANDAYKIFKENWNLELINFLEEFKVILLNRANRVIGLVDLSMGGSAGTVVDPKIVFVAAIKASAASIILCHNHPSGNLKPSSADINITRKLVDGGRLLEITVHDHLIINEEKYFSMAEEGFM